MKALVADYSRIAEQLSPWGRDWARALRRRGHSPRTIESYLRCAVSFERHLRAKHTLLDPTTKSVLEGPFLQLEGWRLDASLWNYARLIEYLEHFEARSPRTINSHFSPLTGYLKHLERNHLVPSIAMDRFWDEELSIFTKQIKKLRARRANTPPTLANMRRVVALEPNLRNRAFLLLAAKTGARKSELLSLDWSDLDLDAGIVRFKENHQHFKRTTFLGLIDQETSLALRLWRTQCRTTAPPGSSALFVNASSPGAGERMGRQAAFTLVTNAFTRAGLQAHNVHSLRHWFSDSLRANNMPDHMIAYLRGDAPSSTLDLYTHLQSEEGMRKLRIAYDTAMPTLT